MGRAAVPALMILVLFGTVLAHTLPPPPADAPFVAMAVLAPEAAAAGDAAGQPAEKGGLLYYALIRIVQKLPQILSGLAVILASFVFAKLVEAVFRRACSRFARDQQYIFHIIRQLIKTVILALGIITGVGTMGVNVSAVVAGLGLTGFALGFALKDALSNTLAGILVLVYKPFGIGQKIAVAGFQGVVISIDLRYTTLTSVDKTYLIPNSILFTNTIVVERNDSPVTD